MASGVGPALVPENFDISVVADRPGVDQMQDHLVYAISYRVNAPTISSLNDPTFAAEQAKLYDEKVADIDTSPVTDVLAWKRILNGIARDGAMRPFRPCPKFPATCHRLDTSLSPRFSETRLIAVVQIPMMGTTTQPWPSRSSHLSLAGLLP
jgi:hypothetical protein